MKKILYTLMGLIFGVSLFSYFYPMPFLALSLTGIQQWHLWQFFTYPFMEPHPVSLIFDLALFWVFAPSLLERLHKIPFLVLYFGASVFAGFLALAIPHAFIAGPLPSLFAI